MTNRQRCFAAFILVLLTATLCHSQTTAVTLQVTDLDIQTWNTGTWSAQLYSPPSVPCCTYNIGGGTTPVPNQTQSGFLSGTGGATLTVTPNTGIVPSNTQWLFNVCPQAYPVQCFTQSFTISGVSQTVVLNPPAIRININNPVGRVTAYTDLEVINGNLGSTYFNLIDGTVHICASFVGSCIYSQLVSGSGGLNGTNAKTVSYTLVTDDNGKNVTFNCSSCTATLPNPPLNVKWAVFIQNRNASVLTVSPNGLQLDGLSSSISLMQNQGIYVSTDGTNYFTQRGSDNPIGVAAGSSLVSNGVGLSSVYQSKLTLDARDLISGGLDCTGVTNHGPALSALTDNVSGTATLLNGNRLIFPASCTINVGSGWTIRNLSAFEISGPGVAGSTAANTPVFKYTGTAGGTAINMDHVNSFIVRGISVDGNKLAAVGISVDEAAGCGGCITTFSGSFIGVTVSDSNSGATTQTGWAGIYISPTSISDVADIKVIDSGFYCHATSTTSAAIKIGNSFNAKNEIFQHNNLSSVCGYGIWALNGNFVARENNFGNNQVASIRVDQASDNLLIEKNDQEADPQFFVAGSAPVVPVTFLNNHVAPGGALNASVYQIDVGNLNPVTFIGNSFDVNLSMTKVLGSGVGGAAGPSLTAFSNKWPNTTFAAPWASPSPGNIVQGSWAQGPTTFTRYLSDGLNLLDTSGLGDNMVSPSLNFIGRTGNFVGTTRYGFQAIPNSGTNTSANSTLTLTQQGFTNGWFATNLNFSGLKIAPVTAPVWELLSTRGTAGSTSYTYAIVAHDATGTVASSTSTIATGNATLNGTNFNFIQFFSAPGAAYYDVYRTASGGTPSSTGKIGTIFMPLPTGSSATQADNITFSDTGLAGDSSSLPSINTTGVIDASASPQILLPVKPGFVTTANGNMGYDITGLNWHIFQNGADRVLGVVNGTPTNGNCTKFVVFAGTISLQDSGGTCGGSGTPGGGTLSMQYNSAGAFAGTTPGTNQGTYLFGRVNAVQGTATPPIEIQVGDCTSAGTISGATPTYLVAPSDVIGCNVVHDRLASASTTITLPVPATLNNPAPIVIYSNYSAFNDTVTPTTYTISAGKDAATATLTVNSGFACKIQLDPVNASTWKADCHPMATTAGGGTTTNALTMNNSNSGAASGSTFNGSAPITISTNSIGAANLGAANAFSTGLQDMSAADYLQPKHATDPATCTEGQLEENTTSHVVKFCSALNTWTALAGGTIDANSGSAGSLGMYVAAGGSTTIDPDASLVDATNTLTYSGTGGITTSAGPLSSGTNGGTGGTLVLRGSTSSTVTFSVSAGGGVWGTNSPPQMGDTQNYGFSQTTSATGGSAGARLSVLGTGATEAIDVTGGPSTKLLNMGNACSFASAITVTTNTTICSWTLPNVAHQWQWRCDLYFNLTTLGTSPTLSLNMNASVAPTSENGNAVIYTTNTGTFTEANNVAFTTTGNNLILTGAAYAGTGTYRAQTSGTIQASATSGTFAITATLGGTAPAGNMAVSSLCRIF